MRRIEKSKPGPPGLLELRRQGKRYADLDQGAENAKLKQRVREALLGDQRFLCCYCMRTIHPERGHRVRIEHHQSQSATPTRDLEWENLLAACSGAPKLRNRADDDAAARKVPVPLQTCDNRKGNQTITINPLTSNVDAIRYLPNGRLAHPDAQVQQDIDEHLNLNVGFLVNGRLAARTKLTERLRHALGPDKTWTAQKLQRYLDERRGSARLLAYFGYLEALLRRWIAKRGN
jgi:uncharacterized protein (TIGR02646 family)